MIVNRTVRPMQPSEQGEVIAVISRAFWHDPLFDFFARDLLQQYELLPRFFRIAFKDLPADIAELSVAEHDGRPRGFAGWLPPGSLPRSAAMETRRSLRVVPLLARVRNRRKALSLLMEIEKRQPREPHWYLALLATDPTVQGRGLGSALLAPVLRRCDEDGIVAYTETQKKANVSWYARAGFQVVDEVRLPEAPTIWCLRRDPSD